MKQKIYEIIKKPIDEGKKVVLAWNGDAYSGLIWWLGYKHLNLKFPIIFFDDGKHDASLYTFIHQIVKDNDLDFKMVACEDTKKAVKGLRKGYEKVFTGKDIPENAKTWNLLKTLGVPYYTGRRSMLG